MAVLKICRHWIYDKITDWKKYHRAESETVAVARRRSGPAAECAKEKKKRSKTWARTQDLTVGNMEKKVVPVGI